MNLTATRTIYECVVAYKAWRLGRMPNAAFYLTKLVEGLFEATPQSLIFSYPLRLSVYGCRTGHA